MDILRVSPGEPPIAMEIEDSLNAMQALVGGTIQAVFPFSEPVALICNDEGKLLGLPFNRALREEDGQVYDLVCGTFFLCGAPQDSDCFTSLSKQQMDTYRAYFQHPELLIQTNQGFTILSI